MKGWFRAGAGCFFVSLCIFGASNAFHGARDVAGASCAVVTIVFVVSTLLGAEARRRQSTAALQPSAPPTVCELVPLTAPRARPRQPVTVYRTRGSRPAWKWFSLIADDPYARPALEAYAAAAEAAGDHDLAAAVRETAARWATDKAS